MAGGEREWEARAEREGDIPSAPLTTETKSMKLHSHQMKRVHNIPILSCKCYQAEVFEFFKQSPPMSQAS